MLKRIIALLCLLMVFPLGANAQGGTNLHVVSVPVSSFGSGKYGFADETGKIKIDYIYDYAEEFSDGYALVMKNRKAYFIDGNGLAAFGSKTSVRKFIAGFKEGRALIEVDGKYGFINTKGQVVIPAIYDDAFSFSEGKAAVCKDGKYGYVDTNGKAVIDFTYDSAAPFNNSIARININGRYGFIDENDRELTSAIYERTGSFNDGLCPVRINNKYSFINKIGLFLTPLCFDWASDFQNGRAIVEIGERFGQIDTEGNVMIAIGYSSLSHAVDGYVIGAKATKYGSELYGVISGQEDVLIPFKYEYISYLSDDLFAVCENGKYGVVTDKNKVIVPIKYNSVIRDGDVITAMLNGVKTQFDINDTQPVEMPGKYPDGLDIDKIFSADK